MHKIYILFFQKTIIELRKDMFHTESYSHKHQTGSKQCASGNKESSFTLQRRFGSHLTCD